MAYPEVNLGDRVKEFTSSSGNFNTTPMVLTGADLGYLDFGSQLSVGEETYAVINSSSTQVWWVGRVRYTATNRLQTVSTISSSNLATVTENYNWTGEQKEVFITLPASKAVVIKSNNTIEYGNFLLDIAGRYSDTYTLNNFKDISHLFDGKTGAFTLLSTDGDRAPYVDWNNNNSNLDVVVDGISFMPIISEQVGPWQDDYVPNPSGTFRIQKIYTVLVQSVGEIGYGSQVVLYNSPAKGSRCSLMRKNNYSYKQRKARYPITPAIIALGE